MTRAELEAAITRRIDAERAATRIEYSKAPIGEMIVARRECADARGDLDDLLDVLDHELAFQP